MKKIAPRQLYFFLATIAPVGKIILMPTQLVLQAKNDLLFPAALNFLLQAAVIFFVVLLAKNNRSLYELLSYTFGKIAAKILMTLFSLFLFYAALLPLLEQKLLVQSVCYDTLPSTVAFAPFFLFSAYLCSKPLASFGRAWDILAPFAIAGFFGILLFSVSEADFGALAPVGAAGAGGFARGFAYTMSWFFDSAIVLLLMGKLDCGKGTAWKSALFYLAGGAAVLLFLAVFYGVFSDIAVRQLFAFSKISKYFSGISVLGRVDYVFIFLLVLVMAFYGALPLKAGIDCLTQAYGRGEARLLNILLSVGVNAVMLLLTVLLNFNHTATSDAITKVLFWIFPAFTLLVPLLCLFLRRSPRETS